VLWRLTSKPQVPSLILLDITITREMRDRVSPRTTFSRRISAGPLSVSEALCSPPDNLSLHRAERQTNRIRSRAECPINFLDLYTARTVPNHRAGIGRLRLVPKENSVQVAGSIAGR
jgi:hypothetical protein